MCQHTYGRALVAALVGWIFSSPALAQTPLDLFTDVPTLGQDYVRIGAWNLRHINLESGADAFLPGADEQTDFQILTATFGKAIVDLGMDLVAIVEHQPRANEPNRLHEIRDWLNANSGTAWSVDETAIEYEDPSNPFGNLQFGLLWKISRVTIDPTSDQLLLSLRQPRDANGQLENKNMRAPWLVPVTVGNLSFDLMVLHLKSGGEFPQADEVEALEDFVEARQTAANPRHLIIVGDWNIRPDQSTGRFRLRRMMADGLMRVLTVEELPPSLDDWERLGSIGPASAVADIVPFTHFNRDFLDTFLDHIAISSTLDEIFDHPISVDLASGGMDLRPGVRVARPRIPEEDYLKLTDHLPVILTLRTNVAGTPGLTPAAGLRIVGALPNPPGDDIQFEQVHVRNTGSQAVTLAGWKIQDAAGGSWLLDSADGSAQPGQTVTIVRRGRPMFLNNNGDTIMLFNPQGQAVDSQIYGQVTSGQFVSFN